MRIGFVASFAAPGEKGELPAIGEEGKERVGVNWEGESDKGRRDESGVLSR
jgi:hypothetical protein